MPKKFRYYRSPSVSSHPKRCLYAMHVGKRVYPCLREEKHSHLLEILRRYNTVILNRSCLSWEKNMTQLSKTWKEIVINNNALQVSYPRLLSWVNISECFYIVLFFSPFPFLYFALFPSVQLYFHSHLIWFIFWASSSQVSCNRFSLMWLQPISYY